MTTVHHVIVGTENSMVAINGKPVQWTDSFTRRYNHAETTLQFARTLAEALGVEVICVQVPEPNDRKRWTYPQVMAAIMGNKHDHNSPPIAALKPSNK